MVNMGNAAPFAVLSTFDSMVIAWLDSEYSNDILATELTDLGKTPVAISSMSPKSPPPAHATIYLGPSSDGEDQESESDDEIEIEVTPAEDRQVRYSPVFESSNCVRALILALRCGIKAAQCHPMSPRRLPSHGETMGGECGLMDEDGMEWKTLPNTTAWNYQGVVRASRLYLWKMIGHGATGRVYLACSSAGTACVLKFILFDDRSVSSLPDDEKDEATKILLAETKRQANTECLLWKEVYPEYARYVRVLKQNSLWALQMPYFNPVPDEKRADLLPKVRDVLERFKKLGYAYKADDLRWRHVGLNAKGECIMFDLESLKKIDNPKDIDIEDSIKRYLTAV
jgi:hypothetical protein